MGGSMDTGRVDAIKQEIKKLEAELKKITGQIAAHNKAIQKILNDKDYKAGISAVVQAGDAEIARLRGLIAELEAKAKEIEAQIAALNDELGGYDDNELPNDRVYTADDIRVSNEIEISSLHKLVFQYCIVPTEGGATSWGNWVTIEPQPKEWSKHLGNNPVDIGWRMVNFGKAREEAIQNALAMLNKGKKGATPNAPGTGGGGTDTPKPVTPPRQGGADAPEWMDWAKGAKAEGTDARTERDLRTERWARAADAVNNRRYYKGGMFTINGGGRGQAGSASYQHGEVVTPDKIETEDMRKQKLANDLLQDKYRTREVQPEQEAITAYNKIAGQVNTLFKQVPYLNARQLSKAERDELIDRFGEIWNRDLSLTQRRMLSQGFGIPMDSPITMIIAKWLESIGLVAAAEDALNWQ